MNLIIHLIRDSVPGLIGMAVIFLPNKKSCHVEKLHRVYIQDTVRFDYDSRYISGTQLSWFKKNTAFFVEK